MDFFSVRNEKIAEKDKKDQTGFCIRSGSKDMLRMWRRNKKGDRIKWVIRKIWANMRIWKAGRDVDLENSLIGGRKIWRKNCGHGQ